MTIRAETGQLDSNKRALGMGIRSKHVFNTYIKPNKTYKSYDRQRTAKDRCYRRIREADLLTSEPRFDYAFLWG